MKNVAIFGCGGHATVIAEIFELSDDKQFVGFIDRAGSIADSARNEKFLGSDEQLSSILLDHRIDQVFIAVGDNWKRKTIFERLTEEDVEFATAVHPKAVLSPLAKLERGVAVMAGAIINPRAHISAHSIVNSGAVVEHDVSMGRFSSLGPKACLGGGASIGDYSAVGMSATVLHGRIIGKNSILGAQALCVQDLQDNVVAYGVPAKIIRARQEGDSYL